MSHPFRSSTIGPVLRFVVLCGLGAGIVLGGGARSALGQTSITGDRVKCEGGRAGQYPCENVDLLSHLSIEDIGGASGVRINDVWGWTDPQTGTEYALLGRTDGTAFVDVSTPTEPVYLGELPTHSEPSTWRDMKVYENHAFVVSEASGHGMQVFDLTQLRAVDASEAPVTFEATAHYDGIESAHNIVVNSETGFAYIVGGNGEGTPCGGGLHMVDVRTPTSPSFVGCFADPSTGRAGTGYTHDAQCVVYQGPDTEHQGDEVCFNANETALNIADVTDKDDPTTIANATYPQVGYAHQAWLTEDHRYLYVDDELDERQSSSITRTRTLVFDVTNLENPELVTQFSGATSAIDHNQYIDGNHSYQANYQSGLRILNVADPEAPTEVAYFDTVPSSNDPVFEGAWSTYPFFDRNFALVSSIGEGLFVVQPRFSPILSLTGVPRGQGALLRWKISETAQTDRIEVEHRPPGTDEWRVDATVERQTGGSIGEYERSFDGLRYGVHQFRIRHISTNGTVHTSEPVLVRVVPSEAYVATGPFPNPAREQALFRIVLREAQTLRVVLYDAMGRRIRVLHDGPVPNGAVQRFRIRAQRRASGTYFLRVQGESVQLLRRVNIVR